MIGNFFNKLYGNAVVIANLRGQARVPYLPEEKLRELRDARVSKTVGYAAETVPYYRSLFKKINIDPQEIRTADELDFLPSLDKEMVRKTPHLFVSTSRKGRNSIPFTTSGTTGMPLKFYHDPNSLLANIAFGEREREVITNMYERNLGYRELHIGFPGDTGREVRNFYSKMTFIPLRPERLTLSVVEPIECVVDAVNSFRPDVLKSYGSYLGMFFRTLRSREIEMYPPRMLMYIADSMPWEERNLIENEFGIPVLSIYNAVEVFKIGFFCEKRKGFHLHEDLCHVKIVNANGEKVASGEKGEVVISNLVNRGTVLLNYRLGDIASISSEKCSCGRTSPLLIELEARETDIIALPNGDFLHPMSVWKVLKGRDEIVQYQLIQHEPKRFELKLVTVNRETYASIIEGIICDLRELLGEYAVIESDYYEKLEGQENRFKTVISQCGQEVSA
jgi:phenylacetate-CoA ligase